MRVESAESLEYAKSVSWMDSQALVAASGTVDCTVVAGGGTSLESIAKGIAQTVDGHKVFLVPITDAGSRTGDLSLLLKGLPAVGDLRNVAAALAPDPIVGKKFNHRFSDDDTLDTIADVCQELFKYAPSDDGEFAQVLEGVVRIGERIGREPYDALRTFRGHTLGNWALAYMTAAEGGRNTGGVDGMGLGLGVAAKKMTRWLGVADDIDVMPISEDVHHMRLHVGNHIYAHEGVADTVYIDHSIEENVAVTLEPVDDNVITLYEPVRTMIKNARRFVFSPGSYSTSILPIALVPGMAEAVGEAGSLVIIGNLTVSRDTAGLTLARSALNVGEVLGRHADFLLVNDDTRSIPAENIPVVSDASDEKLLQSVGMEIVKAPLLAGKRLSDPNDPLAGERSGLKTSGEAVGRILADL